jgi:hypothetical protein
LRFLAVFAVLPGNLQQGGSRSPQKSWAFVNRASEKTAGTVCRFAVSFVFREKYSVVMITWTHSSSERSNETIAKYTTFDNFCQFDK